MILFFLKKQIKSFATSEKKKKILFCMVKFNLKISTVPSASEQDSKPTPALSPGESRGRGTWWAAVHGVAKSQT